VRDDSSTGFLDEAFMTQTALLVIDLQRGAFDGVRCPPVDSAVGLIDNAARLVRAARAGGTPIVFIQHCEDGQVFEMGTPHWELHEALAPQRDDRFVAKRESSAFDGDTKLSEMLEELQARQLVLCGLQSEFCVSNTARSALARGFDVVVAQDAHGTWPSDGQTASAIAWKANADLSRAGAQLRSTEELERALRDGQA
jgi:nicotinamidase-related amidase